MVALGALSGSLSVIGSSPSYKQPSYLLQSAGLMGMGASFLSEPGSETSKVMMRSGLAASGAGFLLEGLSAIGDSNVVNKILGALMAGLGVTALGAGIAPEQFYPLLRQSGLGSAYDRLFNTGQSR